MSIAQWIKRVFDAPSRRRDTDYSKEISQPAKFGVILLFRDRIDPDGQNFWDDPWMREVVRELGHLHHNFASANQHEGFKAVANFLLQRESSTGAFLDFIEISLRNGHAPNYDDDFVDAVNKVLEEYDSPYQLTRYTRRTERDEGTGVTYTHIEAYPRAYLKHDAVIQKQAIEPVLEIFSDAAFKTPAEDFRKALERHRNGDYDGCVTACSSAVEGAIKVVAGKLRWRNVKGTNLDKLAQSFISKSSLPDTLHTSFRTLANWRNTGGDAHGHAAKEETTREIAHHFIASAATLIVLVQSEVKQRSDH